MEYKIVKSTDPKRPGYSVIGPDGAIANQAIMTKKRQGCTVIGLMPLGCINRGEEMTTYKTWIDWPGGIKTDRTETSIHRIYMAAVRDLQKRYAGAEVILMGTRQKESEPVETIKQVNMWR